MVKDDIFEADVEQVEDIADEYCKDIMARIETLLVPDCKVKYIGCTDRIVMNRQLVMKCRWNIIRSILRKIRNGS